MIKSMSINGKPVREVSIDGKLWWKKADIPVVDPQWYLDAVVCEYNPIKQGCTNESMSMNHILRDLSGNGHDLNCYKFKWKGISGIGDNGELSLDGFDDYLKGTGFPIMTDFTVMSTCYIRNESQSVFASKSAQSTDSGAFILGIITAANIDEVRSFGALTSNVSYVRGRVNTVALTKQRLYTDYDNNIYVDISAREGADSDTLWIGRIRDNNFTFGKCSLYSFLMFNRTLTKEEMDWVRNNKMNET